MQQPPNRPEVNQGFNRKFAATKWVAVATRFATGPRLIFSLVFLTVFSLYIATLAPGVVGGDAGEHQLAVPLLGIPHTTGYPLYILTGKVWTLLLPIGSPAWRLNLFSALGGALAAATTALVIQRLSEALFPSRPGRRLWAGAVCGGIGLAFGLTLWQWSAIAGVRSFNVFFFSLLTWQAIRWGQQRQAGHSEPAERSLAWLALTIGLSLAHHRTTLFYLPSLAGWVLWHEPGLIRQARRLLRLSLLSLAPLSLYLFIYIRGRNQPPYSHERITDWASFWFLVGSGDSSGLFFSLEPAYLPARLGFIWHDLLAQLSLSGVLLALLGAVILLRRGPLHLIFQSLLLLLLLWFTLDFEVVNLSEAPTWYLMPAFFICAVWLGLGINGLSLALSRLTSRYQAGQLLVAGLSLGLLTYSLAWPNWQSQLSAAVAPLDDWRQLLRGSQAQRLVDSSLPYLKPNSIIWGDWEQYTPFKYEQLINGRRPDLTIRNPLDRWPEKVAAAHAAGQPIYFSRKPTDLIGTPYLSMAGPLIYLGTEANFTPPADLPALNARFEDQLELIGYRATVIAQATPGGAQAGPILQLLLYWRVPQKVSWDYALSLRLIDAAGREIHQQDATHPVLSSYPTTLWTPGEVVADFYELPLPPAAGPLTLHLLPYRSEGPAQWHNLHLNGSTPPQEGIFLGPFGAENGQ
jgi:hypothetical protein